jgi:hypothetical protein
MKTTSKLLLSALALTASTILASAQDNNNRQNRGGTPEEFRQRMNERLKASLKVTDDEWGIIQPLLEKVTTKQRDASAGRFGGFGGGGRGGDRGPGGNGGQGGGGGGGNDQNRADRPGSAESQALRTALESESTSPEDIKAKLAALREFRKKAAVELATAREDLRKVLSVRQEATLVTMGILE